MNKLIKKLIVIVMSATLSLGAVSVCAPLDTVYAYGSGGQVEGMQEKSMKDIKVKWDLKPDKAVTVKALYAGVGKKKESFKITDYKITNASKKGYKKLSFTFHYARKWTPTAKDIHKMLNSDELAEYETLFAGHYYGIVDYDTGYDLEGNNDFHVTVKSGKWKKKDVKKITDSDGCELYHDKSGSVKVTVTYPKDYKGLCVVVGADNVFDDGAYEDAAFWNGMYAFNATSMYIKGKSNSHWMRVK